MPRLVQYWMPEAQRARCRRGGPAVDLHQQRRPLPGRGRIVGIVRRIEQPERGVAAGGREFHAFDPREVIRDAQVRAIEQLGRLFQDGVPAGTEVEHDDARWMIGCAGAEHDAIAGGAHRAELAERRLERTQGAAGQVQHREPAEPRLRVGTDDPIRLRRKHRSSCRATIAATRTPPPSAPVAASRALRARSDRDSTSRSDRTRIRPACRRATTRAGRSIPPARRRSPAARRWCRQRSPQRGRAWCRSTACWDDPRRARPASCRRATAAAS